MSLRKKIFALFLVLGISLLLGSYAVLETAVFPAFKEFERQSSEEAVTRVTHMLAEERHALEIMNMEYSLWNPTYEYAKGQNPAYADENLDPDYWHSVRINLLAIFDVQGNELFSWISGPSGTVELSLKDELPFTLGPGHPLITHEDPTDSLQGLLNMRSGIMQVVAYPILTSDGKGPIAGTFIVGQSLTAEHIQQLGERATTKLSLIPISREDASANAETSSQGLPIIDETVRIETDNNSVRGYKTLTDMLGVPVVTLGVSSPRKITQIGSKIIRTTMSALAIASAIFLVAALLFLQRLITAPVSKLTNQILDMRRSGDLEGEIGSDRSDEVGVLANEFGELTRQLNAARTEVEEARDEAMAMSKAKTEFLARMSHEIRTPMNGVLGMTELLRDTALDDKQQRFAGTIYESAESLLSIINDILDISKIEAGKIELDNAPFNLQNLVEECLHLLAESAHRKGLELACNIPVGTNVHVKGDPVRLRQVLMNLIGNALKFTEQGEVIVHVEESQSGAGNANFRFVVEDTGIGIGPENLEDIFEPFVQEDGSNTRRYDGTGLGLAISKQLAELMGGEIGVHSDIGKGSTFWFTVELAEDQVSAVHPQPHLLVGKSVYVVDDNETNLEILRHQLEGWGMHVEVACSGSEALNFLKSRAESRPQFAMLLLDMSMPGMDGLQLAQAVRDEHEYRHIPIVMLSSISRANIHHEHGAFEPEYWLTKPVRKSLLHDTLISQLSSPAIHPGISEGDVVAEKAENQDTVQGLHVLLVDDNEVNLTVAGAMLESLGHRATIATNGLEATAAFKQQVFDVVLMDCRMPEMDGFEATKVIREWEDQQSGNVTPIIALTAHALQGDRERCLAAGMDDYLSKPFTKQELASILGSNIEVCASTTRDNQNGVENKSSPAVVEGAPNSKGRILIVDDNDVNQQVGQAMLRNCGYESESAYDGNEALDVMASAQFDLILMDCHMPVRNGYETATEIRSRETQSPQTGRIPIVAVTADFLQGNRKKCLDAGMDDYVTKPITQEELRAVLSRWLGSTGDEDSASVSIDSDGFSQLGNTQALASINRETLDEIRRLDSSAGAIVLREIVVSYCACSTQLMLQLRAAISDRDMKIVEDVAHSLKGGSSQLGAILLASLCGDIIYSAKQNDIDGLVTLSERAAIEHSAVLSGLDRELQNIAA